jgi:hypothetical protein
VRLGSDARQRGLHRAFIGAVRRGVGARQRVAFVPRDRKRPANLLAHGKGRLSGSGC